MSTSSALGEESNDYIVIFSGHLGKSLSDWFQDMEVVALSDGNTLIIGNDLDQPALLGLLIGIQDFGIQLVFAARKDLRADQIGKYLLKE
jgi:hypothetical protein